MLPPPHSPSQSRGPPVRTLVVGSVVAVLLGTSGPATSAPPERAALPAGDQALVDRLSTPLATRTLASGMVLVAAEDRRAPLFALHLQVEGGASLDLSPPPGVPARPGVAHLLEHLAYAGSPAAPHGAYDARLAAAGVRNNAWTQHDAMAFHATGPVEALDLALALEADRLAALDRDSVAARLETERKVVAQEAAVEEDSPGGRDGAALRAGLYPPGHPWRHPVIGARAALEGLDADEVLAWHARLLDPARSVLVVVADLPAEEILDRAEAAFAALPARAPAAPPPGDPPATRSGRRLHTDDVAGVTLWAAWPGPALGRSDAPALALAVDHLVLDPDGWLHRGEERGRLERVQARTLQVPDGGRVRVRVASGQGDATALLADLDRGLDELREAPPAPEDMARLRGRWRTWAARVTERPADRAEILATCQRETGDPACLGPHLARHLTVTAGQVQAAARRWLRDDRRLLLSVTAPWEVDRALPGSLPVSLEFPAPPAAESVPAVAAPPVVRSLPPVGPGPELLPPVPTLHHTASGIPVWLVQRPEVPLVAVEVGLRRGALHAEDPLALLTAGALLDEGVVIDGVTLDGSAWTSALAEVGAEATLGVDAVRAWARTTVLPGREAEGLALALAPLRDPLLSRKALREVRREGAEGALARARTPGALHALSVQRSLYGPDHPLGAAFSAADHRRLRLRRLLREWRAERALGAPAVVVVGDTSPEAILPALDAALGRLPAAGVEPLPVPEVPPPRSGPRTVLVDLPRQERAFVSVLLPVPALGAEGEAAAELLGRALAADDDSRLSRRLREEEGWTYVVATLPRPWPGRRSGVLEIRFAVSAADLPDALAATRQVLADFATTPPTGAEVARVQAGHRSEVAARQQHGAALAARLAALQGFGLGTAHAATVAAELSRLTADDLEGAVADLPLQSPIIVISGDRARVEPALDAAGAPLDAVRSGASVVDGAPPLPL